MSAGAEDPEIVENVQEWQKSNNFSVTLRGHWQSVPDRNADVVLFTEIQDLISKTPLDADVAEIESDDNYNIIFDSFYAPTDFKIKCLTIRMNKRCFIVSFGVNNRP